MSDVGTVYKAYLIELANQSDRPFRLPNNPIESLNKRNDKLMFYALYHKMTEAKINKQQTISRFMKFAGNTLNTHFYINTILDEFVRIMGLYREYKDGDNYIKIAEEIKIAFDFLEEFVIMNEIKSIEELTMQGQPPLLLKLWKQKKVNNFVVLNLMDISTIRKKGWAKLYCGTLLSKFTRLCSIIDSNAQINSALVTGNLKLNSIFNT